MKQKEKTIPREKNSKYVIDETDIEEFQVLIDCLAGIYSQEDENAAKSIRIECNRYLKKKIEELETRLQSTTNLKSIQELNLKTVYSIYHFTFFKTINFIEKYLDKRISMILRMIYNSLSATFEGMKDMLGDALTNGRRYIEIELSMRLNTFRPRTELEDLSMYDNMNDLNKSQQNDKSENKNLFKKISEDIEKIKSTQRDNDLYQDSENIPPKANGMDPNLSISMGDQLDIDKKLINEPKRMTFIHMNDLINELVESKMQIDVKNIETKLPKRTMEAHLHEVFKTKFGLKNLICENLASFIHTMRYYAPYNTRCRVFLSALRNECEEEFFHAINSIETTLVVLLKVRSGDV